MIFRFSLCPLLLASAVSLAGPASSSDFIQAADVNHDGAISREELRAEMVRWLGPSGKATQAELTKALDQAIPEPVFMRMISPPQSRAPKPADLEKMMAALPDSAPAKPLRPRRVLVLNACGGFVHSSIPLAAKTIEALGEKTGAWKTTIAWDASAITAENLKQFDAIFLNNTTGYFLDDPTDTKVTAARRKALLDFVRSGKGLAGIHAASDSYHNSTAGPEVTGMLAAGLVASVDGDGDQTVDAEEMAGLADRWFDMIDAKKAGNVPEAEFRAGLPRALFGVIMRRLPGSGPGAPAAKQGPDPQVAAWPEFNRMIGGYFKYHWLDPQHIVYRIDDAKSPLTAMFRNGFEINDETYTFGMKSWSRQNLHVLASIDYSKMSEADRAKEDYPRTDHDYGLSWIRREGKGRVFYTAHGHSERTYAMRPMLEHLLAGVQYALGDLKADDSAGIMAGHAKEIQ